jgi:hypothetical protein
MEVHAHTHPEHSGERKKWTDYFWDFLMLFLAVTLGFFMENQREHYVEKEKEKQYINSMIDDLKMDTSFFANCIVLNSANQVRIDSLKALLKSYSWGQPTAGIYYLARRVTYLSERTQYNSRTFEQLKNSGGLRLIRHHNILDSISQYYESLRWMDVEIEQRTQLISNLIFANEEMFDAWAMSAIAESGFQRPAKTPPLLQNDKLVLNRYVYRLGFFKAVDNSILLKTKEQFLPNAGRLIRLLKSEYHLK